MADEYTREMRALLEAQRAYFASDDCLRERAALWHDATPEECWAAVQEECEAAERWLARLDPDTLERAVKPEPLPAATIALLERLQRAS